MSNPEIISVKSTEYTIADNEVLKMTHEQMVEEARMGYLIRAPIEIWLSVPKVPYFVKSQSNAMEISDIVTSWLVSIAKTSV